jgi:SNF2 family DNA or RNA helicase
VLTVGEADAVTRKIFIPRIYQGYIEEHILDVNRCGAWAGMGMGKTSSVLTALDKLIISGYETKPALVCAPLRVARSTWPDEAAKWEHLRGIEVVPIVGTETERKAAVRRAIRGEAAVFTINYENLPWLIEHLDGRWPFGMVIADESTKLKGFRLRQGTQRAKALARISHVHATRWVNLTGTPSPNGLQDLWGQTWFLDAGQRLGRTFEAFKHRWFRPSWSGHGIEPLAHSQDEIQNVLRDICLSLDAKDYFDIKEPIETVIGIELTHKARALYTEMEKRMFMEIEGHEIEAVNAASKTMKCLQLASGAVYVDPLADEDAHPRSKQWKEVHDAKIEALEDVIEEAAGMPVLVAYHFRSDLARLVAAFPRGKVLDDDPQTVRDWNAGKIPILFSHPASAGHGLNLQDGGNIIVFFSHDWNLENFMQIIERIGPTRQIQAGYDRAVFIYYIVARDTVDEDVMERRKSKREVQDILMEAMKRRTSL